jgi:DNA-binding NtrC family response regulator
MKVLLIDDEHALISLWREYLQLRGHEVRTSSTVADAREHLQVRWPDAVVVDHELPDGNALDVLVLARELSPSSGTVVCSGHGDALPAEVLQGADRVLPKPLRLTQLREALEGAVAAAAAAHR